MIRRTTKTVDPCYYCKYWIGEYGCQCPDQNCENCTHDDVPMLRKVKRTDCCKDCDYAGDCGNCIRGEDQ